MRIAYKNYELGDREAPLDVLEKCANLFGCELQLFFEENKNIVNKMLVTAFRVDNLSKADMEEVSNFKSIVKSYIKMSSMLEK